MNKKLLSCPFCGDAPTIEDIPIDNPTKYPHKECVSIGCESCDYTLMTGAWGIGWYTSKESAAAAWNSRAAPASGGVAEADQKQPESLASTGLGSVAEACPEGWPTEEMITAFAEVFSVRDQRGTFAPAFRAAIHAATGIQVDRSPEMQGSEVDESVNLQSQAQQAVTYVAPVSDKLACGVQNAKYETQQAADKVDAARYRWLRANDGVDNGLEVEVYIEGGSVHPGHLDGHVDDAMQQEGQS